MKTPQFNVGDWVIHGFRLKQVKNVDSYGYLTVSDGYFETSGKLECRKATFNTKRIANDCESYYNKLYKEFGRTIHNWPDLNRWFEAHCLKMIDIIDDEDRLSLLYKELEQMYDSIVEACNKIKDEEIYGVRLFSR